MTLTPVTLGARLRTARKNIGLTQEQAAEAVGLPRTTLLQIEAGNREVASVELFNLARYYGRGVAELLSDEDLEEDPVVLFRRITGEETGPLASEIMDCIALLREATKLQGYLGNDAPALPPVYKYSDPASYHEAIEQGKEMAALERGRLGLGVAPIQDVAEIISLQSIWAAAVPLPDEVSGVFLHQKQYGVAVLINQQHRRVRRRFSYVHEYAHVLVDRDKRTTPTSKHNESHLIEKRANAFASEFLVPEAGVSEFLDRMNKGATSRELSILYNPATGLADAHESRNDPSAQRITVREVALLAHEYRVSYDVAVYRLSDIGAIRKLQKEELIRDREDGRNLIEILKLYNGETHDAEDQPYLRRQVILLAIESYRRKKITSGRFRDVCCLTNFPADPLLQVAESLMEAEHKDG